MATENEVQSWTRPQNHPMLSGLAGQSTTARKAGGNGLLRFKADLPPEIAEAIDNFERSSFRLTYAIVGFAGAALALTFLIAYGMILVAGR
ncbi:MAG TPA: hypothetical protein VG204_21225 [Terriglobia bacterium]|nr:hypothetical protein [Terriglobia bacterium]